MKDKKKLYGLLYAAEANLIVCFLQMYPIIRFCKMLFKKKNIYVKPNMQTVNLTKILPYYKKFEYNLKNW